MNWEYIGLKILGGFCSVIFVVCVILLLMSIITSYGNFEYKTFSGETGYSDHCYISRGGVFCSSDNGVVQVESYKDIKGGE